MQLFILPAANVLHQHKFNLIVLRVRPHVFCRQIPGTHYMSDGRILVKLCQHHSTSIFLI